MSRERQNAERIDDLDVPGADSEAVKGGLPAVQKVREAAGLAGDPDQPIVVGGAPTQKVDGIAIKQQI